MNKRAYIYARVSTEDQAREGASLEDQLSRCRAKAAQLDADVIAEWTDAGVSAFIGSVREQFEAALGQAAFDRPEYFICWSSSRFGRDRIRAGLAKRELERMGVQLVYCNTDINLQDHAGAMIDGIFEVIDEAQSRQNSQDTTRAMMAAAQAGFWVTGKPPYGYRVVAVPVVKRKRLEVDEAEAAVVRRAFELRLAGDGCQVIATKLALDGLHCRAGTPWTKSTIRTLLSNRTLTGTLVFGKRKRSGGARVLGREVVLDGVYPPIIERSTFDRVQQLIGRAAPEPDHSKATSTHLLTGLICCPRCGAAMHIESASGRARTYWYYNCSAWIKRKECSTERLRADQIDSAVAAAICEQVFRPEALADLLRELTANLRTWQSNRTSSLQLVRRELAEVRQRQSRLYDLLELHGRDAPNLGDLSARLRENKTRIERLERQQADIEREQPPKLVVDARGAAALAQTLADAINDPANYKRTRQWLTTFVQKVVASKREISLTYDPSRLLVSSAVHSRTNWLPSHLLLRTIVIDRAA